MVLAAGRSARMGRSKQSLVLPGRGTLLGNAICQARVLSGQVWVVAGAGYPLVRYRCTSTPSRWLYCQDWNSGLAASLKAGIEAAGPHALGVFVILGDQPLLTREGLAELARCARGQPAKPWAADYGKRVGVPAWIPRALWPAVQKLEGDAGAGRLLNRGGANSVTIPGVELDADTPGDWQTIKQLLAKQA